MQYLWQWQCDGVVCCYCICVVEVYVKMLVVIRVSRAVVESDGRDACCNQVGSKQSDKIVDGYEKRATQCQS